MAYPDQPIRDQTLAADASPQRATRSINDLGVKKKYFGTYLKRLARGQLGPHSLRHNKVVYRFIFVFVCFSDAMR